MGRTCKGRPQSHPTTRKSSMHRRDRAHSTDPRAKTRKRPVSRLVVHASLVSEFPNADDPQPQAPKVGTSTFPTHIQTKSSGVWDDSTLRSARTNAGPTIMKTPPKIVEILVGPRGAALHCCAVLEVQLCNRGQSRIACLPCRPPLNKQQASDRPSIAPQHEKESTYGVLSKLLVNTRVGRRIILH